MTTRFILIFICYFLLHVHLHERHIRQRDLAVQEMSLRLKDHISL